MSFYVFTSDDFVSYRHTERPYSVTIVDDSMEPIGHTFESPDDDFDCAVSFDSNRFAMGFWRSADLTVFDLKSGMPKATFPFRKIGPIAAFDASGNRLLFKSGSQVILLDLGTAEATPIKGIQALDRLVHLKTRDEILVASQWKGKLLRVSLRNGGVQPVELPIDATFFDVKQSPTEERLVLIDKKKGIHCVETSRWNTVWSVSLKKRIGDDHMGVGFFCGDGTLFGACVAGQSRNSMIVLSVHTGAEVGHWPTTLEGLPYVESLMRGNTTKTNSYEVDTLNLATGTSGTISLRTNK